MSTDAYTKEEIIKAGRAFPEKGPICPKCRARIPVFADLSPEQGAEIRQLIASDERIRAIERLRRYTGCPFGWAKVWVLHPDGPVARVDKRIPCPHCRKLLRPEQAEYCPHCKQALSDAS